MANSLSASFPEIRAAKQQKEFFKQNVAMKICQFETGLEGKKFGSVLSRTYSSMPTIPAAYTRGTAITAVDLTDTKESLTINREFAYRFLIDEHDDIQNAYSAAAEYGKKTGEYLSNQIDADVLGEALNAASTVTGGTFATTGVLSILAGANQALAKKNISSKDRYAVISPEFESILVQYVAGKETVKADQVGLNGYLMTYMGYDFYVSNQLTSTAELVLSQDVTANDTVVIAGVTFTFVASLTSPAVAGEVVAGANAAASRVNLAALINAPATTTATWVALSTENAKLFSARIKAVNNIAATKIVVTGKGLGVLDVSETLTHATNVWTATAQLQHQLFGVKGNPYLIVQRMPSVKEVESHEFAGKWYKNTALYGVKTFRDNSQAMVNVTIRSDAFSA